MSRDMETFAARLASFDTIFYPERRTSGAKSVKPITWPHNRPSPEELAQAGFYYNPYETNPDNTTCFLCERALDGWEKDDDPTTEHLKHSPDCGWATMMDILRRSNNPAEIEDPTSDRIVEARRATFGSGWPHDGKRGWVCQSEKMVEGGWYYSPSEEGDDLATCAYCNLSLDGWEPKDDPFNEHYRRSSDCAFFVFAQPSGKKTKSSRSKKARVSKASRLSTQSVSSVISEAPTMDIDDGMDQSITSQPITKTKAPKKSSKSKTKRTKKADTVDDDDQMNIDATDYKPEPPKAKRATRGKKRPSDEMNGDGPNSVNPASLDQEEPPAKKRATKARTSVTQQHPVDLSEIVLADPQVQDEAVLEEKPKKGRKITKKDTSSKSRKVSETALSKVTSKSRIPRDSELDTAIEADLELDTTHTEEQSEEITHEPISGKSKSSKRSKTVTEEPAPVTNATVYDDTDRRGREGSEEVKPEETELPPKKTKKNKGASKRKQDQKSKEQEIINEEIPEARVSPEPHAIANARADSERHESFVSVEIISRDPRRESDTGSPDKDTTKPGPGKRSSATKGRQSNETDQKATETQESEVQSTARKSEPRNSLKKRKSEEVNKNVPEPEKNTQEETEEQNHSEKRAHRRASKVPPKTVERYSDIPQEQHLADSIARSRVSSTSNRGQETGIFDDQVSNMSPLPSVSAGSSSPSPQSSDAENRPLSARFSRLSAARTPILSPSKQRTVQIPLAASTPSPSKRNVNSGHLQTSHPWVPVDIEEILFAGSSDKENDDMDGILNGLKGGLTSPEKRMTVEEWILWNAKNSEEKLKRECERLVSHFEQEGGRAMRALEGIECID